MLSKEDLKLLENMMRTVTADNNKVLRAEMSEMKRDLERTIEEKLEKKLEEKLEEKLEKKLEEKLEESEGFLLDEMERYYKLTKKDIQILSEKVGRIERYYYVKRAEDSERDLTLLLHQKEIDSIKERLAM